jgi:hypothetical protein
VRWAQLNTFLPLLENGGNDDHTPWAYDSPGTTDVTDIYRGLVATHYELGPYLLATGTAAYAAGVSAITPSSSPPANFPGIIEPDRIKDWSYSLGSSYFVVPVVDANTTVVAVTLPVGGSWFEYYDPSRVHNGGSSFLYSVPLARFPVFVRTGEMLPLHVSTPQGLVPHGDESYASALTLLWHVPYQRSSSVLRSSAVVYEFQPLNGTVATCALSEGMLLCTVAPYARDVIVIVRGVEAANIPGAPPVQATLYSVGDSVVLRASPPPPIHPRSFTPMAIDWDGASAAPVHPVAGQRERLARAAAARALSWSLASATESGTGVPELVVRVGAVTRGAELVVSGLQLAPA